MAHEPIKYEDVRNEMELEVWVNEELASPKYKNNVPFYMENQVFKSTRKR